MNLDELKAAYPQLLEQHYNETYQIGYEKGFCDGNESQSLQYDEGYHQASQDIQQQQNHHQLQEEEQQYHQGFQNGFNAGLKEKS